MTSERPVASAIRTLYMVGIAGLLPIMNLHLPLNTALFDYMNGALIGFWLLYLLLHRTLNLRMMPWFVVVLLGSLLSMVESQHTDLNVLTLVQEVYLALFFIVLYNVIENERDVATLVRFWMIGATIQGVLIVAQLAHSFSARAQGTFENPNLAASYVGVSAFLALHPACGIGRSLRAAYFLLMAGALFATKSLSGTMGFVVAAVLAYALFWTQAAGRHRPRHLAMAMIVVALAGISAAQVAGVHNFLDRGPKSVDGREQIWEAGIHSFLRSPLGIGVGPGAFVEQGYVTGGIWGEGRRISLHSDYLSFLVERGVIGFAGLLGLVGGFGLMAWRSVRARGTREEVLWRLGLWAAFCFVAIDSLAHEVFHYRHVWVIFAFIALEDRRRSLAAASAPARERSVEELSSWESPERARSRQITEEHGMARQARRFGYGSPMLAVLVFAMAALAGCSTTGITPAYPLEGPSPLEAPAPAPASSPRVSLEKGDVIEIKFFSVPELNDTQTIRPDGKIALQLVGDVVAMGRTPGELRQDLIALYTPLLKKPDVTVIVREFQDRKVYVGGEVNQPGMIPMPGSLTALEAIMQAGGFDLRKAAVRNVVIIRHRDGQRFGASLDLRDALAGRPYNPFDLEPHDIVFIPQTRIAKVGQWIDQHINQMIPVLGLSYSQPTGKGTITIDTTRTRRNY